MGHGNLSPRQKMINIMYLVLTALLAMNVSAEVLNAFVLVNDSLITTEKNIDTKNEEVYADFDSKFKVNEKKIGPWRDKALKVKNASDGLIKYINQLQEKIIIDAGDDYNLYLENGTKIIKKKDDTETPTFTMLEDKSDGQIRALELKSKIESLKLDIAKAIGKGKGTESILHGIESNLSTKDSKSQDGDMQKWEITKFQKLPLVAVLTMLTKLKTDVINSESEVINYLHGQVDAKSYKFTDLNAIIKPDKSYLLSGEKYRAEIFVGASDTTLKPQIILSGGKKIERFEDGKGIYEVTAGGYGMHSLKGVIVVNKPGSITEKDTFAFNEEYQVAAPSVSVSPTKMNVFYIGVDNPVEITAAGTPANKVSASMTSGTIRKNGGSKYTVKVSRVGKTKVNVSANGKHLGTKEFRVKSLPSPITTIGRAGTDYYKGGRIPKSTLLALSGINATMENFDFALNYRITEFTVVCTIGGFDKVAKSTSRKFTPKQKSIIRQAKKKTRVILERVKARGPDGKNRKISDLVLKLK